MPSVITRLVTTAGVEYDREQPWPGMSQDNVADGEKVKVRLITLFPESEQVTTEGEGDDETDTGSETHPPQYEIWGLTDRTYAAVQKDLSGGQLTEEEVQYLGNLQQVFRRTIYLPSVSYIDEYVDISTALKMVELRELGALRRALEEEQELTVQMRGELEQAAKLREQLQKAQAQAQAQAQAAGGQNGQPAAATSTP